MKKEKFRTGDWVYYEMNLAYIEDCSEDKVRTLLIEPETVIVPDSKKVFPITFERIHFTTAMRRVLDELPPTTLGYNYIECRNHLVSLWEKGMRDSNEMQRSLALAEAFIEELREIFDYEIQGVQIF